jgi:DNA-binding NarL/FixJ family response regulator
MTPLNILVVEDDDVDMMCVERAFKDLRLYNSLERAKDGQEAWDRLVSPDNELRENTPDIILLDLNMPKMSGAELLKKLSSSNLALNSKVFVLTTSDTDQDIINAHKYDISGYLLKSDLLESLRETLETLDEKWMLVK